MREREWRERGEIKQVCVARTQEEKERKIKKAKRANEREVREMPRVKKERE